MALMLKSGMNTRRYSAEASCQPPNKQLQRTGQFPRFSGHPELNFVQKLAGEPKGFGWVSGDEQALLREHGII